MTTMTEERKTTAEPKCADGEDHEWYVARMRGSRVRHKCRKCSHIDPWVKGTIGSIVPTPKVVNGVGEYHHDGDNRAVYEDMTVAELRQACRDRGGLSGYSKMKRDDLVALLSG